jgi:hypothetical protein
MATAMSNHAIIILLLQNCTIARHNFLTQGQLPAEHDHKCLSGNIACPIRDGDHCAAIREIMAEWLEFIKYSDTMRNQIMA